MALLKSWAVSSVALACYATSNGAASASELPPPIVFGQYGPSYQAVDSAGAYGTPDNSIFISLAPVVAQAMISDDAGRGPQNAAQVSWKLELLGAANTDVEIAVSFNESTLATGFDAFSNTYFAIGSYTAYACSAVGIMALPGNGCTGSDAIGTAFSGTQYLWFTSNQQIFAFVQASAFAFGETTDGSSMGYAYVDPMITVITPGFDLLMSPGIGNGLPSSSVAEPATWAMILAGFGGLGMALRSRRKAAVLAA
jgi:hypothetical protein